MLEESLVESGYLSAGGAVDKDGVEDVHLHDFVAHVLSVGGESGAERLLVVVEVDAVAVEYEVVDIADADDVELQSARLHEELLLGAYLFEEHAADGSDAADEEVEHLVFREEERVVEHVERLAQEASVDDERDVRLRGTLCTGDDRDAAASQCAEELTGDAGRVLHVLAHDGDSGQSALSLHGEHGSRLNLLGKLVVEHLDGSLCVLVAYADAGRVL